VSEDRISHHEVGLAAAVGLQTAAIEALIVELRHERQARSVRELWHAAVGIVVGVMCFAGL